MSVQSFDAHKFFQSSKEYNPDNIAEEQLFQLIETHILKILKLNENAHGNSIKLMLMSNILKAHELSNVNLSIHFPSTYLGYSAELFKVNLITEKYPINSDNEMLYKDSKLDELNSYEEIISNDVVDFISSLPNKIFHQSDDIYIEEVPLHDGRVYHLLMQRDEIKNLFLNLQQYISNPQHLLFITALLLYEMEYLSSNKYGRTFYYNDISDKVNIPNKWFACFDIQLNLQKPQLKINTK